LEDSYTRQDVQQKQEQELEQRKARVVVVVGVGRLQQPQHLSNHHPSRRDRLHLHRLEQSDNCP
jgi:hypothetical protein